MICINDGLIQKYVDGESTPGETAKIEKHLLSCPSCSERVVHQKKLADAIRSAYGRLSQDTVVIPRFQTPSDPLKKKHLVKHLSWFAAAACLLLFVILINRPKRVQLTVHEIDLGVEIEVDANQPVSDLPLILNFTDTDGRVKEYLPGNSPDNLSFN